MKILGRMMAVLIVVSTLFVAQAQTDKDVSSITYYSNSKSEVLIQNTVVAGSEPQIISLGILTNNTKQPMRFKLDNNESLEWLRLPENPEQTTVAPGQAKELRVQVLPQKLRVGQVKAQIRVQAATKLESGISFDVNDFVAVLINVLEDEPKTCEIKISITSVKVTDGQGIGEGKLELRITGFADDEQGTWPSSQGTQQVKDGQQLAVNKEIGVFTLNEGETRTFSLQTEVLEVDSGFAGADDTGFGTSTMEVSCETVPVTKTVTINIIGQNDGQVQITYKAVRID